MISYEGIINVLPSLVVLSGCMMVGSVGLGTVNVLFTGKRRKTGKDQWDFNLEDRDQRIERRLKELKRFGKK